MTSLTKTRNPQAKIFFRVQSRRLATSFETFTRSVEHTGPEKFLRKATCVQAFFFWKSPKAAGRQRVKNNFVWYCVCKSFITDNWTFHW